MDKFNLCFREYLESLTMKEHRDMVQRIADACFVQRSRVFMWKGGHCKIGPLYRKEICRVIGRDIFNETQPA